MHYPSNPYLCIEYVPAKKSILTSSSNQFSLLRKTDWDFTDRVSLIVWLEPSGLVLSEQSFAIDPKVYRSSPYFLQLCVNNSQCIADSVDGSVVLGFWKKFFFELISSPLYIGQIRLLLVGHFLVVFGGEKKIFRKKGTMWHRMVVFGQICTTRNCTYNLRKRWFFHRKASFSNHQYYTNT